LKQLNIRVIAQKNKDIHNVHMTITNRTNIPIGIHTIKFASVSSVIFQ